MKKLHILLLAMAAMTAFASCSDDNSDYREPRSFDDQDAPQVVSVSPADNAADIDTFANIVVTYNEPVVAAPKATIRVYTNDTTYYYIDSLVTANGNQLIIPFHAKAGMNYKVNIMKPTVRDSSYNFASDYTFSFSTKAYNNFDPTLFNIADAPVNADATEQTKKLYAFLKENFGNHVLSAAIADVNWNTKNAEALYQLTGKYPAINCFDFIHYHYSAPLNPKGWIDYTDTKPVEDWANNGGIVECMWHWNVPASEADQTNYESWVINPEGFSAKNATRSSRWEHKFAMKQIDIIADYLLALQKKGIPVIWRPFHEARGNYGRYSGTGKAWFWWGNSGPVFFKKLWKMMYEEFKTKGVNNLIWVWTSEGSYTEDGKTYDDADWYPGDEYVDIIARDYYCKNLQTPYHDAHKDQFEALRQITGGKKIIALAEGDAMPSVKNMLTDGAMWSWIMPWYGQDSDGMSYINSDYNTAAFLKDLFNSKYVITRDEVSGLK